MNKNFNKARFVFWSLFLLSVFLVVWYCFAFYEVAALAAGAGDCGLPVGILAVFGCLTLPDKAKRSIEDYVVGGIDDA